MNPIRRPLKHARLTLLHYRLVRRGLLTGRPSSSQGAGRGAPAGSLPGAHSPAGRGPVNFLEADRRSRLAAARMRGLTPSSPAQGAATSPYPGRDLA